MLLILTNSQDVTADYLVDVLNRAGVPLLRFDTDTSLDRASLHFDSEEMVLRIGETCYRPNQFNNVWYRRPERLIHPTAASSPESKLTLDEWAEALEGCFAHIPNERWMNHPAANVAASHKLEQLTTARRLGFSIPDTLVTQQPQLLRAFFQRHNGNVIVKPISVGYVEREAGQSDSIIYTNRVPPHYLDDLQDVSACPTLFQQCIEKTSDVRITVVDGDVHSVALRAADMDGSQRCDIRRNNMNDVTYSRVALPQDVESKIHSLMRHYRLRYAAIDMAVDHEGNWIFFEVNPNGQWAWLDLAGGANIAASFVRAFLNK